MSVQAMAAAFAVRGVSPSEKLLLLALSNYADKDNRCWPSHRVLAEDTGLSERTILTALKSLEGASLIAREQRQREDGSRRSDLITLFTGGEIAAPRGETVSGGGETISPGVGKSSQGGGEMVAPLTTFEPPLEPSKEPEVLARERAPRTKADRGTTLPADWAPSDDLLAYAAAKGLTTSQTRRATERFTNHWLAATGPSASKRDWGAAWRNWILRDLDTHPPPRTGQKARVW